MQPAIFVGHGSPMNALSQNRFTKCWQAIGRRWPNPKVIVAISAHWLTRGTKILTVDSPRTIHDFHGFPPELFTVNYPAPGSLDWSARVMDELSWAKAQASDQWGLDHGVWSTLVHMYPSAQIPVVPVSLDLKMSDRDRWRLGQSLRRLREQDALLLCSGDLVHNLHEIDFKNESKVFDWARDFDTHVVRLFQARDEESLLNLSHDKVEEFRRAHPTPDHFWPFLAFLGALSAQDQLEVPVQGLQHGSISMTILLGAQN